MFHDLNFKNENSTMEDNIGTGSDNKIPLIIGIGAIAVAVLALAFAIKAKGDVKDYANRLKTLEDAGYITKTESSAAISRVSGDVQAVSEKTVGLESYVNTQVVPAIQQQKTVIEGIVKRSAPVAHTTPGNGTAAPVVAGPGEYIVKKGDTFAKVARANGTTIAALTAVNPGVSSANLKIGQKLKLPEKK